MGGVTFLALFKGSIVHYDIIDKKHYSPRQYKLGVLLILALSQYSQDWY